MGHVGRIEKDCAFFLSSRGERVAAERREADAGMRDVDALTATIGALGHWAMFRLGADLKVYLHREPIDFRAGINSLAVLVQETMALDPFAPAVFAFCNRRRDRMKLLFFDRSGFVLVLKRLTEDKFRWPRREAAVVTLTTEQLHWILDGIDIDAMVCHPVRQYQVAG
ncbi:IS66 family insertion sequence element accessory protein TnpB [Mesorhizobium sp. M0976]